MAETLRYGFEITDSRKRLYLAMPGEIMRAVERQRQVGRALGSLTPRNVKIIDIETNVRTGSQRLYANMHNIVARLKPEARIEAAEKVMQVLIGFGMAAVEEGIKDPHLSLIPAPGASKKGVMAQFTWPEQVDSDSLERVVRRQMTEAGTSLGEDLSSLDVSLDPQGSSRISINGIASPSCVKYRRRRPKSQPSAPVHELSFWSPNPNDQLVFFAGMVAWAHPEELLANKGETATIPQ